MYGDTSVDSRNPQIARFCSLAGLSAVVVVGPSFAQHTSTFRVTNATATATPCWCNVVDFL